MKKRKKSNYWTKRFEELEATSFTRGRKTHQRIEKAMHEAEKRLQTDIDRWYARLGKNNKLSIQDAKALLNADELEEFKWTVEEYIDYGRKNAVNKLWMKQLENASSRVHISNLEALKYQVQNTLEVAFGKQVIEVDEMGRAVIVNNFERTAFEIQKMTGFQNIAPIDKRTLDKLMTSPWAPDGKNFSDRIWNRKNMMVADLHQELMRTCILGESPDKAINHMKQYVSTKVKHANSAAASIVQTEQAYFHSVSQHEAFKELNVEEYEIVVSLDELACEICGAMDGLHFPMKDFSPGTTAHPFHPRCRCTEVPYFNDEFRDDKRFSRNLDGKGKTVEDMTFEDWRKKYVNRNAYDDRQKRNRNYRSDKEQFLKYKEAMGDDFPKSFDDFQEMKYNDVGRWESFKEKKKKRDTAQSVISNSTLTDGQKERAMNVWDSFQSNDVDVSGHFAEQFARREFNKNDETEYTFDEILSMTKLPATHVDVRNGNEIVRQGETNIIRKNGRYITIRKGRVSKQWKKL